MAFTAKDVQTLRERTGCGMMDCKKALTETDGDMEKAIEVLREKGLAAAAKKAGRIAAEGVVYAYVDEAKKIGVVIEVNSETDFVAKNDSFIAFVDTCAKTIAEQNPATVEALLDCKAAGSNETVADMLREKILTIGENMKIRRFARYEGEVVTYIHGGGRIGVIAMQVAASAPTYLDKASVPSETIEKEKEILTVQAINEGKPANIAEKMVMGRISKYYKEVCLLEQPFIKDGDLSVTQYTEKVAKELGGSIKVTGFVRYEKGEGLEKKEDNFADEVASMIK